jgi:hypothetical protein
MTDGASHGQIAQHGRASYYDDAAGLEHKAISKNGEFFSASRREDSELMRIGSPCRVGQI